MAASQNSYSANGWWVLLEADCFSSHSRIERHNLIDYFAKFCVAESLVSLGKDAEFVKESLVLDRRVQIAIEKIACPFCAFDMNSCYSPQTGLGHFGGKNAYNQGVQCDESYFGSGFFRVRPRSRPSSCILRRSAAFKRSYATQNG
ncbi:MULTISPECIES: hypothetical protein [unclassified Hyphomicrobium]|uniref:hypothetical protein n=1 Tax=unclassified Hyphomicrobium TaxID=2619925 RepID=UPI000213DCEB|nr:MULTISPECIES: hypothetical protein [unclassified Hyphomicrobium]CCB64500.1 protein of unknown function [Hyphomicrobium sp. MC1]